MRVIIAGSRSIRDLHVLDVALMTCNWVDGVTRIVSGCAPGVDRLGELYATLRGLPLDRYPADWERHGRAAGPIRNELMAKNADALIALWDGKSAGTANMILTAYRYGLRVHVYVPVDGPVKTVVR